MSRKEKMYPITDTNFFDYLKKLQSNEPDIFGPTIKENIKKAVHCMRNGGVVLLKRGELCFLMSL